MLNTLAIYMPVLHSLLKLAGMSPLSVEIEPGTIIHFWVPTETSKTKTKTPSKPDKKPVKPVVVFLHPFGFDGILTWQFQVLALARKYAVYVPDFLFFGRSITDRTERSASFQAECMAKGLGKLGVEKCTLVGLSYGGMVGFKMAEMFPDLVHSLVVSCSVMALTESITRYGLERLGFSSWAELLLPDTVKGLKELIEISTHNFFRIPSFVCRHILEIMFDNRKERAELLEALITPDKDFNIPNYPQKIHLLWGVNDKIFNMEVANNLKEQLEGKVTLHCIENAGHMVPIERPWVYNRHLKKILASLYEKGNQES
ncbi:hypothetical protein Tsubulata_040137 [Turnera subulata]|uniref:AB hydrolase-1 domain-containing protein n=1 Tax=Turnera subulata TaxID=218843 RepID=A0A9Q0JIK9_9ROSI|nr:hypothetical protein Tsubulata_040137 [Turnera subulata]